MNDEPRGREHGARVLDRDIFGRTPREAPDWSHRRGEPRVFAFLWTLYLMAVVTVAFAAHGAFASASGTPLRPAGRMMVELVILGVCVLWPAVRLSQALPLSGGIAASARDLVVLLVPAQALLWPQVWLARWPPEVVVALAALLLVWGLLVGGVLAMALGPAGATARRGALGVEGERMGARSRSRWMVLVLLLVLGGAVAAVAEPGRDGTALVEGRMEWMLSPFTAAYELTEPREWAGGMRSVGRIHWLLIVLVGLAGTSVWLAALPINAARAAHRRRRRARAS